MKSNLGGVERERKVREKELKEREDEKEKGERIRRVWKKTGGWERERK